jgi:radical SAM protein with 4Fe4S-binding SPASM domain
MKDSPAPIANPQSNLDSKLVNQIMSRKEAEKNTIIALQATMFSKTFPGKVLAKLNDNRTVLDFLLTRIREANFASRVVIVTSDLDSDLPIVEEGNRLGVEVIRGSHDDLISRFIFAADTLKADYLVRIHGSNPLLDLEALDNLLEAHFAGDWEYSFNDHFDGVMLGTGSEIVNVDLLRKLDKEKLTKEQRVVGTLFIRQHAQRFKVQRFKVDVGMQWVNLYVDSKEDLERVSKVASEVSPLTNATIAGFIEKYPLYGCSQKTPPQEIGMEKLFIHPEKLAAVMASKNGGIDTSYPVSVELSLTMRCNFDCVWCSDKDLRASMDDDIDLQLLHDLFRDLSENGTQGVVIEGGGEPTIYRDFDGVLDLLDKFKLGKGLITNGSTGLKPHRLERFDWIRVSLDSSTPEEHHKLKAFDGFERVLGNINAYAQHCPIVGVGYVVTNQNIGDIETLVLRLKEFGITYIQFRPVVDHNDLLPSIDLDYLKRHQSESFSIIIDGMKDNMVTGNNGLPCKANSLTSVITADGGVYFCGRLNIYPWVKPIGNLHQQSFSQIWTGEERKRQHEKALDKNFCGEYCPQCRLTKFNELFDRISSFKTGNFI